MGRVFRGSGRALQLSTTRWALLPLLFGVACTLKNQSLSTALDKAYAFDCPGENIRVISHRRIGSDELWAVEACGTKREVERGLEFPATPGVALSEADIEELRENLQPNPTQDSLPIITSEVLQAARAKAGQWCSLARPGEAGVGIVSQSADEQRACQQQLEATTVPLGSERDEQGIVRYWFRVGAWAFPTFVSYHAPACSRLTLNDTPEYCACAKAAGQPASCSPALVAGAEQSESQRNRARTAGGNDDARRAARPSGPALFSRAGLGLGYLSSSGDAVSTVGSLSVESDLWGGLRLHPRFGLGIGFTLHEATAEDSVTYSREADMVLISGSTQVRPWLFAPAALLTVMPFSAPLRVDAEVGIGLLTRASPRADLGLSKSSGLYLASGLGWEAVGDYVDVGLSGKVFFTTTRDDSDSFATSGFGLLFNLWTHSLRPQPKQETDKASEGLQ